MLWCESIQFNSIQFSSVKSCSTLCIPMDCSPPGFPVHHQLLELVQTHVHPISDAIQPCHLLLSPLLLPLIFPSIRIFSNESALHIRWPSIGASASALVLPVNIQDWFPLRLTGLISLLSIQGTLKSLLQHRSSEASILQHSTFFMVQLSHPFITTGKTISLTRGTFVGKVMSLLFSFNINSFILIGG